MHKKKLSAEKPEEAAQYLLRASLSAEAQLLRFVYTPRTKEVEIEFSEAPEAQEEQPTWKDAPYTEQIVVPKGDSTIRILMTLLAEEQLDGRAPHVLVGTSWKHVMHMLGLQALHKKAARKANREQLQLFGIPVEEDEEMPKDRLLIAFGDEGGFPDTNYILILEECDAY